MCNILIVDDHPIIRLAMHMLLEKEKYEIVGEASNGVTAIDLARKLKPDIIVLDIGLPGLDGFEVIERLQLSDNKAKIIVLTGLSAEIYVGRCIRAGVAGFVSKDNNLTNLVGAIKAVQMGFSCFPTTVSASMMNYATPVYDQELIESLSNREVTVLRYLARGVTNKEIARDLLISSKTVSTYKMRLMQKLNAKNIIELSEFVARNF
ncbi:LuxR family two component transcriptional regulator [Buttiauxella sp. BIGb0552]|uniref:response regulator transcription factor n=1 Tax=Buttiauxella sp. BIGb0552 TaxID=2485120 RepID=UPI001066C0F4|nr:response regulator transcription factor [Buttiauxella sp. BIGb0552]TDX20266.1 LuxR family two component transcriptional regulator [Buttiauxella sp. BIGb0552]